MKLKFEIEPWSHQLRTIQECIHRKYFGLFYEMGGGKTATAINILRMKCNQERTVLPTLITCPSIVKVNWQREIEMHAPKLAQHVSVIQGTQAQRLKELRKNKKIVIINHAIINTKVWWEVIDRNWRFLIVDELHCFKDHKSKRTKNMHYFRLNQNFLSYVLGLTGTPILNSALDLWAQFYILDPSILGVNYWTFRAKYFYDANAGMPKQTYFPNWKPRKDIEKTFNQIVYSHAHRVLKADVLDLPPLVRTQVECALGPEQGRMYKDMLKDLVAYLNGDACVAQTALTKAIRLQQLVCGVFKTDKKEVLHFAINPRVGALKEIIGQLPRGSKAIIWSVFADTYPIIEQACKDMKVDYTWLTGKQNEKQKVKNVDYFNNDPKAQIIIANQAAGGIGINLTSSTYSIYYTRNFSLEHDLQSEARNHRGGQTKKVTRIDITAPGTIDDTILKALRGKKDISASILDLKKVL